MLTSSQEAPGRDIFCPQMYVSHCFGLPLRYFKDDETKSRKGRAADNPKNSRWVLMHAKLVRPIQGNHRGFYLAQGRKTPVIGSGTRIDFE
ncbi:hypothetical protein N7516_001772 [Penicillium verrucosum]|uniref:uncharacterized protein n=1 Tax=Penicillium verrucosum TaxID=60171 RepID=UPI0025459696|nr:uncharacterized protein N7516_001772 [Penicillium verrucosum]KAJ5941604.1 hypothetical protein N7516_001772 [Penicillium verrucosum]